MKEKVEKQLVLVLLEFEKIFQIGCDVIGTKIRRFLIQEGKLIAYFNEKLNKAKMKYFAYDQSL